MLAPSADSGWCARVSTCMHVMHVDTHTMMAPSSVHAFVFYVQVHLGRILRQMIFIVIMSHPARLSLCIALSHSLALSRVSGSLAYAPSLGIG